MASEFVLNDDNYYSPESNWKYCSKSQWSNFYGLNGCEARAMAELRGEYVRETPPAFLLGSLVDTLITEPEKEQEFLNAHPEMISSRGATKGQLKAEFQKAHQMVDRIKEQPKMLEYLNGEHQKIFTGNLFGLDFKIKIDSYLENKAIVDLKTTESIRKPVYHPTKGKCTFVECYGYLEQGAIYQEIVFQNTGKRLPFVLACVSKETNTDVELIWIDNQTLHETLYGNEFGGGIADQVNQIRMLKKGEVSATECGHCDYCLSRKKIKKPIHYLELLGELD